MSIGYKLMYGLGLTPWEHEDIAEPVAAFVEGDAALSVGRALDIGCGTGRDAVYLASHGWDVTAIDVIPKALNLASQRAVKAGVDVRWVNADISSLEGPDLGQDHDLLLDLGCFHGLTGSQRARAAVHMNKQAAPGATLLLFAFKPGRRGPAPSGLDAAELRSHFPEWDLVQARTATEVTLAGPLRNADPSWYRLVKR